jgi:hypothetical protein
VRSFRSGAGPPLNYPKPHEHARRAAKRSAPFSMACLSRPAVLVAEAPNVRGYGRWVWLGDLCHLLILLLATWMLVVLAFHWAEQRWLRLIGI